MRFRSRLIAAVAAFSAGVTAAADNSPYIFEIPAERPAGDAGPLGSTVQAVLHIPDADRAADMIRAMGAIDVIDTAEGRVTVSVQKFATTGRIPDSNDRADTFVIDYGEEAVAALTDELRQVHGELPSIAALTQFVFEHIDDKTYLSPFDLASKVAATGRGDCTEHAVLLTALARATGYAANVIFGVVLIESDRGVNAYGHAWSEIHDGNAWQLADATLLEDEILQGQAWYLPTLTLNNEGPGYTLDMARMVHVQPARVSHIENAPQSAPDLSLPDDKAQ